MRSYLEVVNENKPLGCSNSWVTGAYSSRRKASDEFTPLLSYIDGKDINDKGVQYCLSIRCASLKDFLALASGCF